MPAEFTDRNDFDDSQRGLIARLDPLEVTEGIYQVRGFDLSNMTLVEGEEGVIVIDPLISVECAAAALAFYRAHRGDRRVTAVIYTHAHLDHFGGVLGVVDADTTVPIVAPAHFLEHAVSENVYAGNAMLRRGSYYAAMNVHKGPTGHLGMGLGPGTSSGTVSLLAPTLEITHTGQREVLDGVTIDFQMTPGTECPAEMNFYFPDRRALCMSENATHNMHNLLTLRGAQVRDPRIWSRYLAESIELFAERSDVSFASHHWPTWGTDAIVAYLRGQRDLYCYLHDQTVRLLNRGLVGSEIAELVELPPGLDAVWHTHGYYGTTNHNVKAIFQRYLGWYDGNPAHLWQHPPEAAAARYVEALGGIDAAIERAREFADRDDLRFAAELASHAVFAAPDRRDAAELLASVLERLGFGSESATWRNCFLTGAEELRHGITHLEINAARLAPALTTTQLFDSVAIRLDGPRAWGLSASVNWVVTDEQTRYRMELSNGALVHFPTSLERDADVTLTLTRAQVLALLTSGATEGITIEGDAGVLATIVSLTEAPDPDFAVVTP